MFIILSLNDVFGSSLRDQGTSLHSLAPVLEKAFLGISSFVGLM